MMKIGNEDTLTNAPLPRLDYLLPTSQAPSAVATGLALVNAAGAVVGVATEKQES
jgi:hypothetical protein